MKLPSIKSFSKKEKVMTSDYNITVSVQASGDKEAKEMKEAIQSFVSHFTVEEMKNAAQKLKSPANRKMIKTFL